MKNQSLRSSLKITVFLFLGSFILLALRPIPQPTDNNCAFIQGSISQIVSTPEKDIFFELQNQESKYYINRGLELDLDIDDLKSNLLHKTVKIVYVDHWSPLDPFKSTQSIAQIEHSGEIFFSRITD